MRVFPYFTGLCGLFIVALAAPTSEDSSLIVTDTATDITASAWPNFGKVRVCNGRRGKGTCVDLEPRKDCVELQKPVRFNVQSLVQPQGLLCAYTTGKNCIKVAFGIDSIESKQTPDVSPKWSRLLKGFRCRPSPVTASAAGLVGASAPDDSSLQVRAEAASPDTAIDLPIDASLDLGKVRICNGRGGQGHCVDVNAHMQCVQLSAPIRFNVQSLVQSEGNFCSYSQGNNCDNSAFVIDSSRSEQSIDVTKWSRVITGVQCISGRSTALTTDLAASAVEETSNQVRAETARKVHVRFYNEANFKGDCLDISVQQPCFPLPDKWKYNIKSFTLSPNVMCRFYQRRRCSNKDLLISFHSLHAPYDWLANIPEKWQGGVTFVSCRYQDYDWKTAGSLTDTISYSPFNETPRPHLEARNPTALLAGDALLCSGSLPQGPCYKALANGQCTDVPPPVDRNVREIHQKRGSVCEYFSLDKCAGKLGSSESKDGDLRVPVPSQIVKRLASIKCRAVALTMGAGETGEVEEIEERFVLAEAIEQ